MRRIFWQSIVASMTNPKTILFFLSFLPQFVLGTDAAMRRGRCSRLARFT